MQRTEPISLDHPPATYRQPQAPIKTICGVYDVFLSVFDSKISGTAGLVYSTNLGSANSDVGAAVAVDDLGHAYITGYSNSRNLPTTAGVFQPTTPACPDDCASAFVAKINPFAAGVKSL